MQAYPVFLLALCMILSSNAQWSFGQPLSESRSQLASGATDTEIFFAGGRNNQDLPSNVIDIYSPGSGLRSNTTLSVARTYLASASLPSFVFFAGGYDFGAVSAAVDIWNASDRRWYTANLSVPRANLAGASLGTKVLFAGGYGSLNNETRLATVDIYDTATGIWTTANLSLGRSSLAAATANGKVFFAGGMAKANESNVVDIFDGSAWTTITLSVPRTNLAVTSVGDRLVLFAGGRSNGSLTSIVDIVEIYDAVDNTWLPPAHLSQSRDLLSAATVGNFSFFSGGRAYTTTTVYVSTVDIYDYGSNTWLTTSLSQEIANLESIGIGNLVYFAGGSGVLQEDPVSTVEIYDTTQPLVPRPPPVSPNPPTSSPSASGVAHVLPSLTLCFVVAFCLSI